MTLLLAKHTMNNFQLGLSQTNQINSTAKTPCKLDIESLFAWWIIQFAQENYKGPVASNRTSCRLIEKLIQVIFQFTASARMAQLTQSLSLNLADTFASHMELLPDLFQSAAAAIIQPEA